MNAQPQKEHEWLHKLVGDWTFENECIMGPDQLPSKFKGTETVRSLGGLWFLCEGGGEMPGGGTATTLMTLGYDPAKKRYVGTFIGSMFTHLWIYDGALDAARKVLTLDTVGPSFGADGKIVEGKMAQYQDIIEFLSDDHRTLSSQTPGEDGKWHLFMTAHYRRKK
ncbi:MAG: DUF1579 domain-containing protein [Gemmataceae bacterium]|nr:DUF1579 domain-containing protein [Gemmataceae bacterium]